MKKFFAILCLLALPVALVLSPQANATTISSTSYSDGRITVQGGGDGEVQIAVFNLNKEPIYFTTVATQNGKFNVTLPAIEGLEQGEHVIQSADYDGSSVSSATVVVPKASSATADKQKDTGRTPQSPSSSWWRSIFGIATNPSAEDESTDKEQKEDKPVTRKTERNSEKRSDGTSAALDSDSDDLPTSNNHLYLYIALVVVGFVVLFIVVKRLLKKK